MRAARIDANQNEIVAKLRSQGLSVWLTHTNGHGAPDIVVGSKFGAFCGYLNFLFEIKDGSKPPSARKLTPDEQKFHSNWQGQIDVIHTWQEAMQIIEGNRKTPTVL